MSLQLAAASYISRIHYALKKKRKERRWWRVTLHVHKCSDRNPIIPLMRRPNTDSTPNKPITLPHNQHLVLLSPLFVQLMHTNYYKIVKHLKSFKIIIVAPTCFGLHKPSSGSSQPVLRQSYNVDLGYISLMMVYANRNMLEQLL